RAKKLSPHITFLRHDIQKPFKSNKKYDVVQCLDVLEHLENPQKAIRNMFKWVKQDGIVLCSTPNDYQYARDVFTHINVKRPEAWRKLFRKAGFTSITIKQVTFLPFLYRLHWRLN